MTALKTRKFRKDDTTDHEAEAELIASDIDLSGLNALVDITPAALEAMAAQGGTMALAQIGVLDRGELVNQVSENSVDYAQERAAELVGKKWVNGVLIDNPEAEWSITQATRDELRDIIAQAFAGNLPPKDVENAIAQAGAFSKTRAALIARTEISRANNYGSLAGYIAARDKAKIQLQKAWSPDLEACDVCIANEDDGPIDLEDEFFSGDLAPPAHPNCECSIVPVTARNAANYDAEDDEEE